MRGMFAVVVLAGCYAPKLSTGVPCPDGVCPGGQVCSPATRTCERTGSDAGDAAIGGPGSDAPTQPASPRWRRRLTIRNISSNALSPGFTIRVPLTLVLAQLLADGKVNLDFSDLRVIGDGAIGERDRVIDIAGASLPPALSFSLQAAIAAGATSTEYGLYYGDPNARNPPASGAAVFPVYDDFTTGIAAFWLRNDGPITAGGKLVLRAGHTDALATNAATDNLPIVSAIELSARVSDPTSEPTPQPEGTFYYWFGYQRANDFTASDPWALWIARAKNQIGAEQKSPVGCEAGTTCNSTPGPQDTSPHVYAIERDPSATRFYLDGALSYTASVTNQADYAVMMRNYMATSDLNIDWIRARARVSPDPTITIGAEEAL